MCVNVCQVRVCVEALLAMIWMCVWVCIACLCVCVYTSLIISTMQPVPNTATAQPAHRHTQYTASTFIHTHTNVGCCTTCAWLVTVHFAQRISPQSVVREGKRDISCLPTSPYMHPPARSLWDVGTGECRLYLRQDVYLSSSILSVCFSSSFVLRQLCYLD